jgi:hypothetical protein
MQKNTMPLGECQIRPSSAQFISCSFGRYLVARVSLFGSDRLVS